MQFEEFGLNNDLLQAISYMGFEKPTLIQEKTIPEVISGNDIIACAQTGTGKTAAFLLPVLNRISKEGPGEGINTMIIVPTRELAVQIEQQVRGFAYFVPVSSLAVYGGGDGTTWDQEKRAFIEGVDILVATPGKLISHINLGYVNLHSVKHFILDEADRMLDIGFYEDIMKVAALLPAKRQTLMFSATMAPRIRSLAKELLTEPVEIATAIAKPAEGVLQAVYLTYEEQKIPLITNLITGKEDYSTILIFSSTKKKVYDIVKGLKKAGEKAEGISSDLEQKDREEVLNRFKAKKIRILVATDVLSRGIDIKDIDLIVNFDVPQDAEDYVHRVGRTARAEKTGVALTLVSVDDMFRLNQIEKLIQTSIVKLKVPSELGVSPEWNPAARRERNNSGRNFRHKKNGKPGRKNKQHSRP